MSGDAPKAKTSPYEYDLASQAEKKYGFEKRVIRPLTDVLMRRTEQEREPWMQERAIGQGVSQAASAITPQTQAATRQMLLQPGMSPGSGAFVSRQGAIGLGASAARSGAGVDALAAQDNRYIQGLQNITRIGTRQASQAQAAMTTAAQQHNAQLGAAAAQQGAENAAQQQTIGTGVGAAVSVGVAAAVIL